MTDIAVGAILICVAIVGFTVGVAVVYGVLAAADALIGEARKRWKVGRP